MRFARSAGAILSLFLAVTGGLASAARAGKPVVAADILPVHGLVSSVAGDRAEVRLLRDGREDPHGHALRPSQMALLTSADLVVYVGSALEPELGARLRGTPERVLALLDVPGTRLRAGEGGTIDPHAWLSPDNAALWADAIAAALSKRVPEAADVLAANAGATRDAIDAAARDAGKLLQPVAGVRLATGHDFLGYFADSFGLTIADTLAPADDAPPSLVAAARIAAELRAGRIDCLVVELGGKARLPAPLRTLPRGRIVEVDIVGATLSPGPSLYPALIRRIASDLRACVHD